MWTLNSLLTRWSRSWWSFFIAMAASLLSLQLLRIIGDRFAAVTRGYQPFDLQNPLSLADILAQLPFYGASSRSLYWIFIVVDMIFPVIAALPLVFMLAIVLRASRSPWAASALRRGFALTPLLLSMLDWIENGFFMATVALYPEDITTWGTLAIAMKVTKLGLAFACNGVILSLALYAVFRWLSRRRDERKNVPTYHTPQ